MKKNILTIVIMAASLINLVLTIVLVFSIMPAMNKTGNLVDKVASVIDLEIESGKDKAEDYVVTDLKTIPITYENSVKINLQKENANDDPHYGVIDGIVVSFNPKAEGFKKVFDSITNNNVYVSDTVSEVIGEFTLTSIDQNKVRQEAVKRLQEKYDTKAIVDISLTNFLTA